MLDKKQLYQWCSVPAQQLEGHPKLKVPFKMVKDSAEMGLAMAKQLADAVALANREGRAFRAIVPCGPNCWYAPFTAYVNQNGISLKNLTVFHMDECLDWQAKPLAKGDPYNFRSFMEAHFYAPVNEALAVPAQNRVFPAGDNITEVAARIAEAPIDLTLGGWGQDGHIAYNQAKRDAYTMPTLEELRQSTIRVQQNNTDTVIALAQRVYGSAWQFVPPMSVTLGLRECLSAKKVRLYSDTGAWKQTALRVGLFSAETAEYPLTLLQSHPDAMLTATEGTAAHPISLHPEWEFKGINA